MSEIVQNKPESQAEQLLKAQKNKKSSSKLLVFDANLVKSELVQQIEVKSTKNSFHTGQKLYLQDSEGKIVANIQKCPHFTLPCIEYTLDREVLAKLLKQYDAKFSEDLLEETLEVGKKLTILDKYEIELDYVNMVREDFFILKYTSTQHLTEPGQVAEEPFKELIQQYKETFKTDSKFLEHIFLNSLKDIESSERLLQIIKTQGEDGNNKEQSKQQQMMDKLNLIDFVGEKMLHLPVYKKDTGFFNYSQYQVLNLETQKLSDPIPVEKINYKI
ncbi:hypothetical protein ABPG74_012955 [Tetrahymena malaccensis]